MSILFFILEVSLEVNYSNFIFIFSKGNNLVKLDVIHAFRVYLVLNWTLRKLNIGDLKLDILILD